MMRSCSQITPDYFFAAPLKSTASDQARLHLCMHTRLTQTFPSSSLSQDWAPGLRCREAAPAGPEEDARFARRCAASAGDHGRSQPGRQQRGSGETSQSGERPTYLRGVFPFGAKVLVQLQCPSISPLRLAFAGMQTFAGLVLHSQEISSVHGLTYSLRGPCLNNLDLHVRVRNKRASAPVGPDSCSFINVFTSQPFPHRDAA